MRKRISRRRFLAAGALTPAALPLAAAFSPETRAPGAATSTGRAAVRQVASPDAMPDNPAPGAWARWIDRAPASFSGATWGMPWPRGRHRPAMSFSLRTSPNTFVPLQTWPLAYWPDGSLKWTAHAAAADPSLGEGPFEIVPGRPPIAPVTAVTVTPDDSTIAVDTGVIMCRIARAGTMILSSIAREGRELVRHGRLVLLRQDRPSPDAGGAVQHEAFESTIDRVDVEQSGPIRAVIRVEGRHASRSARHWLPFTLRLYFYAGSDALRVMHTIVMDGDEQRDFIRGVGLRFTTPLPYPMHDRHVRFAGEEDGVFGEAVRGLTGLRRDPGEAARREQVDGRAVTSIAPVVARRLELIPAFGDWTLVQPAADSFLVRKRTKEGHGWLDADRGRRSSGLGYIGGPAGGVAFGLRNFWQSHPAQLDIRDGAGESAEVTMWVWAPEAPPMDLRFYHDGMGQDTFEKQLEGLEITYEDYEPGFGTPLGVARTSEMHLWMLPATPPRDRFAQLAEEMRRPPVILATPQTLQESEVFGRTFARPAGTHARLDAIEARLAWLFDFYRRQQDERSWYGFWNYGDVMHTYDADRHVWRYDVGGYAWDNSELSTDIWLWLYVLRTGRSDVFRFAEAMTRHTGEVDVHHLGRFAPLGSRHNVMHWGCSAKQLRISTVLNRRYYYYLTADERVGDLMREQIEAARTLRTIEPGRKLPDARTRPRAAPDGDRAYLGFGIDWGSIAGAWLTEWERTGNPDMRARLEAGMRTIAAQPRGFFTGSAWMNLHTGAFEAVTDPGIRVSHLSAAFGLPEVCAELIELIPVDGFERAWLQYCELYNASSDEQERVLGAPLGPLGLRQGHARLTAYAAHRKQDAALAVRAWEEFDGGRAGFPAQRSFAIRRVEPPAVLNPVEEAAWVSTNGAAQWGLAAIQCLALAGSALLEDIRP